MIAVVITPVIVDTPSAWTVSTRGLPALIRVLAVGVTHLQLPVRPTLEYFPEGMCGWLQELLIPANRTKKVDLFL